MANVLLLNGSPHAHGAIDLALTEVAQTLQDCGLTTEIVHIGQQDIRGCIACGRCGVLHRCVFDDAVNALAPKFEAADALIVGSPVYYASANGTLTNLLDRLFYSTPFDKTMKVGAAASCIEPVLEQHPRQQCAGSRAGRGRAASHADAWAERGVSGEKHCFRKGSNGAAGEGETGRDEFYQINRIIAKKAQGVMFLEPFLLILLIFPRVYPRLLLR